MFKLSTRGWIGCQAASNCGFQSKKLGVSCFLACQSINQQTEWKVLPMSTSTKQDLKPILEKYNLALSFLDTWRLCIIWTITHKLRKWIYKKWCIRTKEQKAIGEQRERNKRDSLYLRIPMINRDIPKNIIGDITRLIYPKVQESSQHIAQTLLIFPHVM